jgi:hypothetical protein
MNIESFELPINELVEKYNVNKTNEPVVTNVGCFWLYLKKFKKNEKTFNIFYFETFPEPDCEIAVYRENIFNITDGKYEKIDDDSDYSNYRNLYAVLSKIVNKKLWRLETNEANLKIKEEIANEKKAKMRNMNAKDIAKQTKLLWKDVEVFDNL